jgi:predicted enzyme related to lactoylglutathione lyase
MGHRVVHWQILSADPDAAADFYASALGWTVSEPDAIGYRSVETGASGGIDGGIWPIPPGTPEAVQLFVEVANVATALDEVIRCGGKLVMPAQTLPEGDTIGLAADPLGRPFGLLKRRTAITAEGRG